VQLQKIKPKYLSRQIKYIYILRSHTTEISQRPHLLIPDGTFELILNFGHAVYQADHDREAEQRPCALFAGGFRKQFSLRYTGSIYMIGIVFNPVYQNMMVNDRMDIYGASLVKAEQIFGSTLQMMIDSLPGLTDTERLREHIENYFMKFFIGKSDPVHSESIRTAVETIQRTKGNVFLSALSSHVCMSTRNFRRVFTETIGMSPKEYIRIIRSKNILHLTRKGKSIDTMAFELGYHDPSHLIRDFKAISGVTPRAYVDQLNGIDESFMRISQYARQ
jgi:AraC-like DNA-binding protein